MAIDCEITRICWERVNLSLQVTLSGPAHDQDVRFTIVDKEREHPVRALRVSDRVYQIRINITNFQDRAQIPDGTWRFVPHVGGVAQRPATFDLKRLAGLDDDSRTFIYAGHRVCYLVIFGISEDDERPELLMRTYQMFRNPKPTKDALKPPLAERLRRRALPRSRRIRLINC
jgi:CDP-ribitol ribitolphosphotransferase / teichoic acid ribitol-phosphate polymerase